MSHLLGALSLAVKFLEFFLRCKFPRKMSLRCYCTQCFCFWTLNMALKVKVVFIFFPFGVCVYFPFLNPTAL